jgi:hypothetical protein
MAKVTLVFAVLLIVLGCVGYWGTGRQHSTALIPAWFGVALGFGGLFSISRSEIQRKVFAHINVTVGVIGLIGALASALHEYGHARSLGESPDPRALTAQLVMAALLLIYVNLCVRSFIQARRSRQE